MKHTKFCKTILLSAGATLFAVTGSAQADPPVQSMSIECNWGKLTMEAIQGDLVDQGEHSADPSGDGHGPGTADEPRAGLANVVAQGHLEYTCELIEDLLFP